MGAAVIAGIFARHEHNVADAVSKVAEESYRVALDPRIEVQVGDTRAIDTATSQNTLADSLFAPDPSISNGCGFGRSRVGRATR